MINLGAVGYGIAALGYALLAVLLAVAWEGRGQGWRLIAAALATAGWAAALAFFSVSEAVPAVPVFLAGSRDPLVIIIRFRQDRFPRLSAKGEHLPEMAQCKIVYGGLPIR